MSDEKRFTDRVKAGQFMDYVIDIVVYTDASQITSQCTSITFINDGTANMFVLGRLFAPNTGMAINGNNWERDTTKYPLRFEGAGTTVCTVIRKTYTGQ